MYRVNASTGFVTPMKTGHNLRRPQLVFGPDVIAQKGSQGLVVFGSLTGDVQPLPGSVAGDGDPSIEGSAVAFDNGAIFLMNVDLMNLTSGPRRQLTSGGFSFASQPAISSGGRFVVYITSTDVIPSPSDVWRQDVDGSSGAITPAGFCRGQVCSRPTVFDGDRKVAFAKSGTNPGIYVVNADGSTTTPFRVTSGNHTSPAVSPDDKYVVYGTPTGLEVSSIDGTGQPGKLTNTPGDTDPDWEFLVVVDPAGPRLECPASWSVPALSLTPPALPLTATAATTRGRVTLTSSGPATLTSTQNGRTTNGTLTYAPTIVDWFGDFTPGAIPDAEVRASSTDSPASSTCKIELDVVLFSGFPV